MNIKSMTKFSGQRARRQFDAHLSKTTPFTLDDLRAFKPKEPLAKSVAAALAISKKPHAEFKILDIGCGRGLAHWLAQGFDVYGGKASDDQVALARQGLTGAGHDPARIVQLDLRASRYPLATGTFDFTYFDNVIEHVEDLHAFVRETARLTRCNGRGFHIFPSKWKPTEVHLRVPFVHWLPKNRSRYYLLRLAMWAGVDPAWIRNNGKTAHEAAEDYYVYLQKQTYYRPHWEIAKAFESVGLAADFRMTGETITEKIAVRGIKSPQTLGWLVTRLSALFHTTILTTSRPC